MIGPKVGGASMDQKISSRYHVCVCERERERERASMDQKISFRYHVRARVKKERENL